MNVIGLVFWSLVYLGILALIVCSVTRNKVVIVCLVTVPIVALILLVITFLVKEARKPFPFATQAPDSGLLVGSYRLNPASYGYLNDRQFSDLSATIVLHSDHTFQVTQMPRIWTDGLHNTSGYDTCVGSWSVGASRAEGTFTVTLQGDRTIFPNGAVFLQISAPKGNRTRFALAVPIFTGSSFDYIYFTTN
jgi:hypothetical protein